jgi:transposase
MQSIKDSITGQKNKLTSIFKILSSDTDVEWEFIDGSYVKAHQHSAGAKGTDDQVIGLSRGGNTSKIHLAVDSYGLPIAFEITGGEVHDSKAASKLIDQLPLSTAIVGDKGYDSQSIRDQIEERGSIAVIPRRKNSKIGNADLDVYLYKLRHLVENAFARLKQFRAIATRYDKLKRNFVGMLALACAFIWLPM